MNPIEIHDNEKVLLRLRKHWIILLRDTGATAILAILPFLLFGVIGFLIPVPLQFQGMLPFGALVSAVWLLVIWLTLAVLWTNYYLDMWIVTNQRIISVDQITLFNRTVTTLELENIQEITVHTSNAFETFLHYGTINIETASPEDDVLMEGIPHPERIRTLVLEEANRFRQLEVENEEQKQLLRTASHEMKNYLAKDAAALAEIAEGAAHPEMLQGLAGRALSETRKGVQAMTDLLAGQGLRLEPKVFDFATSVRDFARNYELAANKKGVKLEINAPDSIVVNGDQDKLMHIVVKNLLDNALHYTPGGLVRVTVEKGTGIARLVVADTGVGLSLEDIQNLFTPGGKGEGSTDVNPESTGYGLSIVKQLVEVHGGTIRAESAGKGKGAAFIVELPAA